MIRKKYILQIQRILVMLMVSLLLLTGCSNGNSGDLIIDGRSLYERSRQIDELYIDSYTELQKEKYRRHYDPKLYFADLKRSGQELEEKAYQYWDNKIRYAIQTEFPMLKKAPYILRTDVEFVNEAILRYQQGELKADEVFRDPQHTMRIKIELDMFVDKTSKKDEVQRQYQMLYKQKIAKELIEGYMDNNVEQVEFWGNIYNKEALKEHSIQELSQEKQIQSILDPKGYKEEGIFYLKTPYYESNIARDGEEFDEYDSYMSGELDWATSDEVIQALSDKYKIPFFQKNGIWFAAEEYPDLFFMVDESIVEPKTKPVNIEDYFLSTLYQSILNKHVERIIEEEGMSDEVLFFVSTEPTGDQYTENNACKVRRDCRTIDEKKLLKKGYGSVEVGITLIHMTDSSVVDEEATKEKLRGITTRIDELVDLHDTPIDFAWENLYIYEYMLGKEEQQIAKELFKQYRMTERWRREDPPGIGDVFSLYYITRAETPAFHFLDIFGEKREIDIDGIC
ncbi:MAG: hypothetical protein Q4D77_03420 [Peptostreptococcaceae bacterium]|nr:hypothetical protein [Peptostreptococcaceae bacterium]